MPSFEFGETEFLVPYIPCGEGGVFKSCVVCGGGGTFVDVY